MTHAEKLVFILVSIAFTLHIWVLYEKIAGLEEKIKRLKEAR